MQQFSGRRILSSYITCCCCQAIPRPGNLCTFHAGPKPVLNACQSSSGAGILTSSMEPTSIKQKRNRTPVVDSWKDGSMGECCRPPAKTGAFGALPTTAPNPSHGKDPAERTSKNHLESVMGAPFSSRVFEEPDQLETQPPNRLNLQPSHAESQGDTSGSLLPVF